jgi:O-antigen ligase
MNLTAQKLPHRGILIALACIPSVDCVLNQVNNGLHVSFGPLSLLQVFRGYLVVMLLTLSAWKLFQSPDVVRRIPVPAFVAFLVLAMAASKELVLTGTLSMGSVVPYLQMAYWLLFWITISLLCEQTEQAELILKGLALGALLTAASVYAGFVFGGLNFYEDDAVSSSAGWFDTAKMITGVLIVGGVAILYLGRKRAGWLYPFLALVCFSACIATYARAGAVALGAATVWLAVWWFSLGRRATRSWLSKFFVLLLGAVMLVPLVISPSNLFSRWNDLEDHDKAGSGRATFWKDAADVYVAGSPAEQVMGRGYASMSELLFLNYGADIKHTHNDALDMLLVAGACGALWLLSFVAFSVYRVLRTSLRSHEGAASAAILVTYLCHGQFTGQIWGTDAMSYYMLSLTALYVISTNIRKSSSKEILLQSNASLVAA